MKLSETELLLARIICGQILGQNIGIDHILTTNNKNFIIYC